MTTAIQVNHASTDGSNIPLLGTNIQNSTVSKTTTVFCYTIAGLLGGGLFGFIFAIILDADTTYFPIITSGACAFGGALGLISGLQKICFKKH